MECGKNLGKICEFSLARWVSRKMMEHVQEPPYISWENQWNIYGFSFRFSGNQSIE